MLFSMSQDEVFPTTQPCRSCGPSAPLIRAEDGFLRCAACNRTLVDPGGPPLPGSVVLQDEEFEEVVPGQWAGPPAAYITAMVEAGWTKVSARRLATDCWRVRWAVDPQDTLRRARFAAVGAL